MVDAIRGFEIVIPCPTTGELIQTGVEIQRGRQGWQRQWEATVAAETERTRAQLESLAAGSPGTLPSASVVSIDATPGERRFGMCGRLQTWDWPGT